MIGIVTDSTCDLPQSILTEYGIIVVPMMVIWGNDQYRDRVDMQPEEFYRRLEVDPQRPTSSQATAYEYQQAYEQAAKQGAKEILVVSLGSALSGAYQMAVNAAQAVKIPVRVVDSKSTTMGLGWQVLAAARAAAAGADLNEILRRIDQVRKKMVFLVSLDTLEYLQKGGRIGSAAKWVGGLLQVRPLVSVNHDTGTVEAVTIARTQKALIETMYKRFFSTLLQAGGKLHVAVMHGHAREKAEELVERIRAEYNPAELIMNVTGPVLGAHTGPGALALCGYAGD